MPDLLTEVGVDDAVTGKGLLQLLVLSRSSAAALQMNQGLPLTVWLGQVLRGGPSKMARLGARRGPVAVPSHA